jgi:DNA-binding CsgD family transcriptional regulator
MQPARRGRGNRKQRAMLVAAPDGKIQFAEPAARRWLKEFFGPSAVAGSLPRKIATWLSKENDRLDGRSLVVQRTKAQLYLKRERFCTDTNLVLLFELIKKKSEERSRRQRHLTRREREVLFWLARGKSNSEIGSLLGITSSTVGKHLERIYQKLGVENRTAASNISLADHVRFG